MADEIIDFYKKAKEPEEPQKPIEEQKETPVPEIPKPDEPFDRFLLELAEKLQKEKVITEKQQETFVEQIKEPVSTDPNENDPFKKFIGSFANILKEDELVNREENIKEATISFINKLKEQPDEPFIIKDESIVKVKKQKYLPPKIAKKIQRVKGEEQEPVIEQSAEIKPEPAPSKSADNLYLKELQTSDKKKNKIEDKISNVTDIKKIVSQLVQEQFAKYPNLGFTGGGGGTNAVQYAEGGTMNGDLTVNGTVNASTYLSGGTNLLNILSSSGGSGGFADRFVSGPSQFILDPDGKLHPLDTDLLTLQSESSALSAFTRVVLSPYGFFAYDNNSNSVTFDSVSDDIVITSQDLYEWTFSSKGTLVGPSGTLAVSGNIDATNKILSGGVDLANIFITSAQESQTLAYDTQTELLSITRGNSISLSSLSDKSYANSNFLKLSGGTISGNLTIQGNISALGTATFANTVFTTTSALSVVNTGPGPALYVFQAAGPYDVASFYDGDGIEVLHVGNAGLGGFGKVGVNESFPNEELTVRGSISATEIVYANQIGIGTNSPNSALTVSGSISASGNLSATNITVGPTLNCSSNQLNLNLAGAASITFDGTGTPAPSIAVPAVIGNGDFTLGSGRFGSGNIILRVPSGNSVEQRNGLNPQAFRIYNTYTAGTPVSSEFGYTRWSGNTFQIGTSATGSGSNNRAIQFNVGAYNPLTLYEDQVSIAGGSQLWFFGRSIIRSESNGILRFTNWGANDFNLLRFGGSTAAFPALKNSLSGIQIRRADDSNFAPLTALNITATNTINTNSYLSAGVNLLDIFSGGGAVEKKFDFVTDLGIDYSYSGTAVQGTIETSPTWKLIRLTYNNNGTISNQASAIDSWTGRLTATYI